MNAPRFFVWLAFLLVGGALTPAAAQDTRGGLVPDAVITLADGQTVKAEDLRAGMKVWSQGTDGTWAPGAVAAIRRTHADSYYQLKAGSFVFEAMGSHRVALADGRLVRLDTVKAGDQVLALEGKGTKAWKVEGVRVYPANLVAYDLLIEGHRPFVVDGLVVAD